MIRVGTLSASQVVAAFRNDFAVRRLCETTHETWPDGRDSDPNKLMRIPALRLQLIARARGPFAVFYLLECSWIASDFTVEEFDELRSFHGAPAPGAKTLVEFYAAFSDDSTVLDIEGQRRVVQLCTNLRAERFDVDPFVAITAEAGRITYSHAPVGSLCLLDGHHRYLAMRKEKRLPDLIRVFVGSTPETSLGLAVLNEVYTPHLTREISK